MTSASFWRSAASRECGAVARAGALDAPWPDPRLLRAAGGFCPHGHGLVLVSSAGLSRLVFRPAPLARRGGRRRGVGVVPLPPGQSLRHTPERRRSVCPL